MLRKIQQQLTKNTNLEVNKVLKKLAHPISLLVALAFVDKIFPSLQFGLDINTWVFLILNIAETVFWIYVFLKLVQVIMRIYGEFTERTHGRLDDQLVPILHSFLTGLVIVLGLFKLLILFGVDTTTMLAGATIGGLAFALAAQDTLKNFFGSLMIFIDRPFQIGDWVTSGEIDGTVEEVGFRSTRIRTFRDSVMYVPNSIISNSTVDNHGLRKYRRFYTKLSVTYDSPARLIQVFVKGIEQIVKNHPNTRKDYYNIFLNDYAASSLDVMLYIFFEVPDWNTELKCRQEIMLEVNKLAEHLGVRFAFPTQTLMIEEVPGQRSLTPDYKQTEEEMTKELDSYFNAQNKK